MNDLISRQDTIISLVYADETSCMTCGDLANVVKVLQRIPSAQPYTDEEIQRMSELEQAEIDKAYELGKESMRKTGKWITTRTQEHDGEIYCSHCGGEALTDGDYRQVITDYCPHCGARMESEKDD